MGSPPRARGAGTHNVNAGVGYGSPPRARGAAPRAAHRRAGQGITPACAGSRPERAFARLAEVDHPRVRGEQRPGGQPLQGSAGSPPRARGAVAAPHPVQRHRRITPACAGSRIGRDRSECSDPDHPRVRGEQLWCWCVKVTPLGSPPRARGAGRRCVSPTPAPGITPACAGSRPDLWGFGGIVGDHPRVRGEQTHTSSPATCTPGSPPRARGAVDDDVPDVRARGITPACAGSRVRSSWAGFAAGDHPRVRGEQTS